MLDVVLRRIETEVMKYEDVTLGSYGSRFVRAELEGFLFSFCFDPLG